MRPKISVVINTLNEENNLGFALNSVYRWADEIVVVDMHSDDRTVEIAKQYNALVYLHPRMNFADPARNFAISKASGDWVLILDADEMVPKLLSEQLIQLAAENSGDIFMIPFLNYLLGAPLHHTGWGAIQDCHLRFFRKDKAILSDQIHAYVRPAPGARIVFLPDGDGHAIYHFNYINSSHFVQKLDRYTTIEAQQKKDRGESASKIKALRAALLVFVDRYIRKQGYRDGWRGFYLSGFMAAYRWITYAKLQELQSGIDSESVSESYRQIAQDIVDSYSCGD